MKKIITFIFICGVFVSTESFAQSATEVDKKTIKVESGEQTPAEEYHAKGLLHQIYLEESVKSLDDLEYEKDGEKLKGKLSEDGKRIIVENYYKRGRVKATVTNALGEQKTVSKSSCFIDIVIPL